MSESGTLSSVVDTRTGDGWMEEAVRLARIAENHNEVPVGAIVVKDNQIIGRGWNRTITDHDPTAHAEMVAIREAGQCVGNYRLVGCDLYVTLEPCPMCAGAIVHSRLRSVTFGAQDPKTGAAGSVFDILRSPEHNHQVALHPQQRAQECSELLRAFFKGKRGREVESR